MVINGLRVSGSTSSFLIFKAIFKKALFQKFMSLSRHISYRYLLKYVLWIEKQKFRMNLHWRLASNNLMEQAQDWNAAEVPEKCLKGLKFNHYYVFLNQCRI